MTATDSPSRFRYEGNGVTDTFAFTGRVFSDEDLVVEIILRSNDSLVDTLTLDTDYSVTINGLSSASVVVTGPNIPSSLHDIQIRRETDKTQDLLLPTGTVFPAKQVEYAFDKSLALIQELQTQIDLKVGIPITDSGTPPDVIQLLQDATSGASAAQTAAESARDAAIVAKVAAELAETNAETAETNAEAAAASASVGNLYALTTASIATGDFLAFADISDSNLGRKATLLSAVTATLLDQDDMASNSATQAPTQQSVKAYVDAEVASSGGLVPIKTVTVSSPVSSVDFVNGSGGVVLDSTYKRYAVIYSDVVPASDGDSFMMRTSTDSGASYDSGASDYQWAFVRVEAGASVTEGTSTGTNNNRLCTQVVGSESSTGCINGRVDLLNIVGSRYKAFEMSALAVNDATSRAEWGFGRRLSTTDINGIRLFFASGNIASGTFTLYGYKGA